jgi:Right handed beta helix region
MVTLRLLVCVCLLVGAAARARAADYYISSAGHDGNSGSSASTPWQSLARVNAVVLQPGDRVLLRGGDRFAGGLALDDADAGTAAAPIIVTSYGSGRATIRPAAGDGISVYNTAGIRISNINVEGAGDWASGIMVYTDLPGGVKLAHIRIDSVDVSGFGRDGVEIGSWNGTTGFRDVRMTGVVAHANARTGIIVYAQAPNTHESVYVGYSRAFDNPGIPAATTNSGSGIVLGGVNGGTVERSVAFGNGRLCTANEGPVGIWTYDSTRVLLQHNESYNNRSSGPADGGGFDLDQNVSYSVVQYNYSHGNDGAGYLIAHAPANDAHRANVIRYNISENDARRNSYGAIEVWGRTVDTDIYNNTIFVTASTTGTPRAVRIWNAGITDRDVAGLRVRNNILQTTGGLPLVEVSASQIAGATGLRFEGNAYFASGSAFRILWNGATYSTLTAWRATTQETAGGAATGSTADPLLQSAGAGGIIGDASKLESLAAYRLAEGSPAADAGRANVTPAHAAPAARDYFGNQALQGPLPDIGAHERTPSSLDAEEIVLRAAAASRIAGGWRKVTDPSAAGGTRLTHPNAGAPKLETALAAPVHYFEMTFNAVAGRPYRVWLRGNAEANFWGNDSVFVQFSGAVTAGGSPTWRIGTTSATHVNLEDCSGCGLAGWGWQDNGWGTGVLGALVYFQADGPQTMRVQTREDGFSIDQIVLSPSTYLTRAPGALRNDATLLGGGATGGSLEEIVIHAADVTSVHGDWAAIADSTAAGGTALRNPNRGAAKIATPLAAPASYVDVSFDARAGLAYHVWVRMRAEGNAWANDSIYMQLSAATDAAGAPVYRIGTTRAATIVLQDATDAPISGWGWNDAGWASMATPVYFERDGRQTLRIQQREDGAVFDQIVISARRYLAASPGALTNDRTIVAR